jgi:flagella basal body P-ring formation protein FlgA
MRLRRAPLHRITASICYAAAVCVPAQAAAQAAGTDSVPVAAHRLARGVTLTDQDVAYDARTATASGGSPVVFGGAGWVTRRVIAAGEILRSPAVVPAPTIRAGESVQCLFVQGRVQLTLPGVALTSASVGEEITIRLDARRRIPALVAGPGRVTARAIRSTS